MALKVSSQESAGSSMMHDAFACAIALPLSQCSRDKMLKALKHADLDNSYEAELRKFLAVDLLIVDDFALDSTDLVESWDAHETITS